MKRHGFWIYLSLLSLAAMGLVLLVTSRYGAGVSADAAKNMSTAESLLAGRGFFDHSGQPLVYWPPLYPLLLAGLGLLTGVDVFIVGWILNVFLLGSNVFLSGILLGQAFRERPVYTWLGALFVAGSESALRIHANVSSDPLYITFSLVFLLAANRYMLTIRSVQRSGKLSAKSVLAGLLPALWLMALCAALSMLQRWLGASLLAMGGIVVLVARWRDWARLVRDGFVMSLSLVPVAGWVYFHNIQRYSTFWGNDSPPLDPWINFEFSLTKIMHWFLPYHPRLEAVLFNPYLTLGALALLLLLIARRQDWGGWWRTLWQPEIFPTIFFLPLSLVGIAMIIVTGDHLDPRSDRYYVGFLVPVIMLLFLVLDCLVLPRLRADNQRGRMAMAGLFLLWFLAYPTYSMVKYVSVSMENGETSNYNYYNNRFFRENPAVAEIQKLVREHPDAYTYSNYADGVWFYTRRSAPLMPRSGTMNMDEIQTNYQGWPGDKPGYILWFLPNEFKHVVPPDMLAEIADVQLVFTSDQGEIYTVQARP